MGKCSQIQSLRLSGEDLAKQGAELLAQGSKTLEESKTFFAKLDGTFDNMKKTGLLLVSEHHRYIDRVWIRNLILIPQVNNFSF